MSLSDDPTCPFRASADQMILQTSWIFRINVIYSTLLSIGCFIGVTYCILFMRKHPIFHESTSVLLYLSLFFAVLHEVTHVCLQIIFLFWIQMMVLPFNEPGKDYLPNCQFITKQAGDRANIFLLSSLLVTVINFVMNIGLLYLNKLHFQRLDYTADFSSSSSSSVFVDQYLSAFNAPSYRARFDVQLQYQRTEAIMTSKAISILVIAQISSLGVYSGGSWLFRQAKDQIPVHLYSNLVIWVYAISYATVTLPLIIVFCIKYVRRHRQRTIHHITSHRESQQSRMDELKMLWS
uniref:Uncharacterized protein n=1 Tax=Caenorhabditis japonica TaxID=281687 RepID=A0A8R1E2S1_CAEJA